MKKWRNFTMQTEAYIFHFPTFIRKFWKCTVIKSLMNRNNGTQWIGTWQLTVWHTKFFLIKIKAVISWLWEVLLHDTPAITFLSDVFSHNLAAHRGLHPNSFGRVDFSTREDEHTSRIHSVCIIVSLLLAGGGEIIAPMPAELAFIVQPSYYDSSFSLLGSSQSLVASQSWVSIKNWPPPYGCKSRLWNG